MRRRITHLDFIEEIKKTGLTIEQYESCLKDIRDKVNGLNDLEWGEIKERYNLPMSIDTLRKANSFPFGGAFVSMYSKDKNIIPETYSEQMERLRKERIKIQTLNTERNRIDRCQARQELYYENIGQMCQILPLPDFKPTFNYEADNDISYILALSDCHYGATFKSSHNEYSREIFKERLDKVACWTVNFIFTHGIDTLHVVELGDTLQGLIRMSDLKANDMEVVKCVVEISRLLAAFLNEISAFVNVEYYHVPTANHTQTRPIGSKASELAEEDLEYIISNYIKDLLANNGRVNVHLAEEGEQFVRIELPCHDVYAMHGHQFKNISNALKDFRSWMNTGANTLLVGHFHASKELTVAENDTDCEVIVAPSMVGSDPYSDRIMRGSKAAVKIYGFDDVQGYTESYKCILN